MRDSLFMCRQIMRMYTCVGLNLQSMRLFAETCPEILAEYFAYEPAIKQIFSAKQIEMYPCGVESQYGQEITIVPEIFFVLKKTSYCIPDDLLDGLKAFLRQAGIEPKDAAGVSMYFAYTGRCWDRFGDSKLVTDGLQRDGENDVIFDFDTYQSANYDTYHHRLVHELLHTLGISEAQMNSLALAACLHTYNLDKDFVKQLQHNCVLMYNDFQNIVSEIQTENSDISDRLSILSQKLYDEKAFMALPEEIVKCVTYLPTSLLPPDVGGYEVLFM